MTGGHGHVVPRADGAKARCGGPGLCSACSREAALLRGETVSMPLHSMSEVKPGPTLEDRVAELERRLNQLSE